MRGRDKKPAIQSRPGQTNVAIRIGNGFDVHRLAADRDLIMGGVKIPFEKGLLGHSDADVLTHAICDALLGAAGKGDIGHHFPDTDEKYRGISSLLLLKEVRSLIAKEGWRIANIDATVIAQRPYIKPYINEMINSLGDTLEIPSSAINIKATTTEGLGFTGRQEGISAMASALLEHA
ncbi:MAG: 2-C-methyl-D-erythritol 2,4-cyclodiphosphate synthase [Chitinophagales bacterium]